MKKLLTLALLVAIVGSSQSTSVTGDVKSKRGVSPELKTSPVIASRTCWGVGSGWWGTGSGWACDDGSSGRY